MKLERVKDHNWHILVEAGVIEQVVDGAMLKQYESVFERLSPKEQHVLSEYYAYHRPIRVIAARLMVSSTTVIYWRDKALKKIKGGMEKERGNGDAVE